MQVKYTKEKIDLKEITARKPKSKLRLSEIYKHIFIIIICICVFYPLILMLQMSLKNPMQILYDFFSLKGPYHFENYGRAWKEVSPYIGNSIIMAGGTAILAVIFASLAGYAFAKLKFPGSEILFLILFAKMMLPGVMNLIPQFVMAMHMGLLNTYWVEILFSVAGAQPFWVFVMRIFIKQLPEELFDSIRIDGANEIQVYRYLAVPLLKPIIALMSINVFISVWNDYIWPLVTITSFDKRPLTVGLAYLTSSMPGDFGPLTAGYAIASVPLLILFIFGMKHFVEGLTAGAIKL